MIADVLDSTKEMYEVCPWGLVKKNLGLVKEVETFQLVGHAGSLTRL